MLNTRTFNWTCAKTIGERPINGRRNHAAAIIGHSMVVFGGIDSKAKVASNLHVLNLKTY